MKTTLVQFTVLLNDKGLKFPADAGTSLLDAARQAGLVLPSSCRNGTCRTCMCKMLNGEVAYRIEWPGLSQEEKTQGYILPCVAFAQSDLVLEGLATRTL
jgi:ferredoxin